MILQMCNRDKSISKFKRNKKISRFKNKFQCVTKLLSHLTFERVCYVVDIYNTFNAVKRKEVKYIIFRMKYVEMQTVQ